MTDKQPMQAAGGDGRKGSDDGIDDAPAKQGGGESGGGGYPNPNGPDNEKTGGFFGHGGQSHINYSGPGAKDDADDGNANAVTKE